jgi:5-deoxy-5-amino-3-dehydroquinate synthase
LSRFLRARLNGPFEEPEIGSVAILRARLNGPFEEPFENFSYVKRIVFGTAMDKDGGVQVVPVSLPDGRSYSVHVGVEVRFELAAVLAEVAPKAKRVAIVTQQAVIDAFAFVPDLGDAVTTQTFVIGPGEAEKSLTTVESLCRQWSAWGMTRNDVVIAIGGGLVTDVGGFAASVYLRGVQVIYVSTTLLGMIDAAIGGKTGVNLPEGKNLVGAFWQPSAVLCDLDAMQTMPPRELRSGLGEMVKYHFIEGTPPITRTLGGLESLPMEDRIARCVAIKSAVVAADEREGGLRAVLNYGHTLAHAIEIATDFSVMHGEAVAVGLVYAAEVAYRLGRIDRDRVEEHRKLVSAHDLSVTVPAGLSGEEVLTLMARDKKALDGITFVLDGNNGIESVRCEDRVLLLDALEAVRS